MGVTENSQFLIQISKTIGKLIEHSLGIEGICDLEKVRTELKARL